MISPLNIPTLPDLSRDTAKKIHIPLAQRRARQHHAVRVEGHGGDGRGAAAVQEAAVGLDGVEEGAVDVEDVDVVVVGAAGRWGQC